MQTIEITCCHCGMTGAKVRQGVERIAVDPTPPCCNTLYVRGLGEALSDFEAAVAKRLKISRYQTLLFQEEAL